MIGGNYSQDILKDSIYKKSSLVGLGVSLDIGERFGSQDLLYVLVEIRR